MSAQKYVSNLTEHRLDVTLFVRQANWWPSDGGEERIRLEPGMSANVRYGGDANPYLNGIGLVSLDDGETERRMVGNPGDELDKQLNTNSKITVLSSDGGSFRLDFSN